MTEPLSREIDCQLCSESYAPVIEPAEDERFYRLYCSSCAYWISIASSNPVKVAMKEVLGLKGEALALAIQTCLAPCHCGAPFSHDAGGRCPVCIEKIEQESKYTKESNDFRCPWNLEEMKKFEGKILEYLLNKMDGKEETLGELIERFESGQMTSEEYMEAIDSLQYRESRQVCVVQTWAMILGPDIAFRAAEEHELVERYGTRVLVSIAKGLEISHGKSVLSTLSLEQHNFDGPAQKEIATFIRRIGGGF